MTEWDAVEEQVAASLRAASEFAASEPWRLRAVDLMDAVPSGRGRRSVAWRHGLAGRHSGGGAAVRLTVVGLSVVLVVVLVLAVTTTPRHGRAVTTARSDDVLLALRGSNGLVAISPVTGAVVRSIRLSFGQDRQLSGVTPTAVVGVPGQQYGYLEYLNMASGAAVARVRLRDGQVTPFPAVKQGYQGDLALDPNGQTLAYIDQLPCVPKDGACPPAQHDPRPWELVLQSTLNGKARSYPISRFVKGFAPPTFADPDEIGALAFSPDGQHLLLVPESSAGHASLVVVDIETLRVTTLPRMTVIGNTAESAAWGLGGTTIFVGSQATCPDADAVSKCSVPGPQRSRFDGPPLAEVSFPSGKLLRTFAFGSVDSVVSDPKTGAVAVGWNRYLGRRSAFYEEILPDRRFGASLVISAWVSTGDI
jgi:hypothetical protein